jgi:transcriptional regulator GlxA family with amidase domain
MPTRTVMLLAFEGAGFLDVSGPAEVFSVADALVGGDAYRIVIASPDGSDATSSSGFRIGVGSAVGDLGGPLDTVLVPGTWTWPEAIEDPVLMAAVAGAAGRARRVAGVCVGAFLMAAAGLLDGRRATTHWQFLDALEERFPEVRVERDPIFVVDGRLHTSAGVTAGIDLALAMVEADHGPALARRVARHLVVFMQRPGGQSQFSVRLEAEPLERSPLRTLLDAVAADPAADHRLAAMSERAGFSERHLTRVFARELGTTPARYVEMVRVEAARSLLETTDAPLESIARQSGLGSPETLRRAFGRVCGTTPHAYRQRFVTTGIAAG